MHPARNRRVKQTESRNPVTDVRTDRSEVPIYLPGTPSNAFVEHVERFVRMLR